MRTICLQQTSSIIFNKKAPFFTVLHGTNCSIRFENRDRAPRPRKSPSFQFRETCRARLSSKAMPTRIKGRRLSATTRTFFSLLQFCFGGSTAAAAVIEHTCAVLMKNSCCGVYGLLGKWTRSLAEAARRSEKASAATLSPSMSHTFSLSVNSPST